MQARIPSPLRAALSSASSVLGRATMQPVLADGLSNVACRWRSGSATDCEASGRSSSASTTRSCATITHAAGHWCSPSRRILGSSLWRPWRRGSR